MFLPFKVNHDEQFAPLLVFVFFFNQLGMKFDICVKME